MKLKLKVAPPATPAVVPFLGGEPLQHAIAPPEFFHVERGVGLALIAAGVCEEYVEPVKPEDVQVKWTLIKGSQIWVLKANCPVCHQGMTAEAPVSFRHCRREDEPPANLAAQLDEYVARKRKQRPVKPPLPQPPNATGRVNFI